jgi:hypothetical protein
MLRRLVVIRGTNTVSIGVLSDIAMVYIDMTLFSLALLIVYRPVVAIPSEVSFFNHYRSATLATFSLAVAAHHPTQRLIYTHLS